MNDETFQVEQLDHVELYVSNQQEAAQWYERVLELEICREYKQWAAIGGPLMISSDGGKTKLALFQGHPHKPREAVDSQTDPNQRSHYYRVAFRVDGTRFIRFIDHLSEFSLTDIDGQQVTRDDVMDHELAFSLHFCDLDGNRIELTTYDYESTAAVLESEKNTPT